MKYLLTLVLISTICFTACYQEESNKYTTQANGLNFTKTEVSNGVVFNWEEAKMFNFTEYIITKHPNSTPAISNIEDLDKLNSSNIVARNAIRQDTFAKDSISTLRTYYRLYVVSGSKVYASDEIVQNSNFYVLQEQKIIQILVDKKKGRLYLFYSTNALEIIDLKKMKQIALFDNTVIFSNYNMSLGYDQSGNTELYSSKADRILVIDGENLRVKETIYNTPKGKSIYNTVTDENSNIFFVESDSISKYDPLSKKISKLEFNKSYLNNIRVTKDGRNVFTGSTLSNIYHYTIDQSNGTVSYKSSPSLIDFSNSEIANFESTIICGANGTILTMDFEVKKNLANEVGKYIKSIFDDNDKIIYSIGSSSSFVYKFENKAGFKNIENIPIRSLPSNIFFYDGKLFTIGLSVNFSMGVSKYVLQRILIQE